MRFVRPAFTYALLALIALTTITPLVWMVLTSLHAPLAPPPTVSQLFRPEASRFVEWSGDLSSTKRELLVPLYHDDLHLVARFEDYTRQGQSAAPAGAKRTKQQIHAFAADGATVTLDTVGSGSATVELVNSGAASTTQPAIRLRAIPDLKLFVENYIDVLGIPELPIWRFALNTILVTAGVVLFQLILCSLAAYGFARLQFPGRDALFFLFLITMMIPAPVLVVSLFAITQQLGWLDTYAGLIIPFQYLSTAFGTFLLRQHMITLPRSLDDAGRLDGCGDLRLLWHILLPACRPALATLAAFAFIWTWCDFYWPLLATGSMEMRTLEVGLSVFRDSYAGTRWPLQMTAAMIVMTPVLIVFLAMQRFFVRGIATTGLKE